ncbi:hypothetical protein [Sinorhizobium meliloti]|uniref:hypothetical protein n=1 Tax=Rhizobium meliloti TaxID=382 RepID=UPI000FDBA737|nr:hypothetical protein [Sinorhizobium meliloti]RVQ10780.1 hypothetical protein CN067_33095 [Sinorhizobium meliloti]RVQ55767.1 hypothetical protein CN060_21200 [Sinorhizobium meliloti]
MTDNRIVVCGVHTASPITTAYLDLSPDIRARAEEIAGSNRPVTWPEVLLLVGQGIAGERDRCARVLDDDADRQEAAWNEFLASGKEGSATSYHTIPRGYAAAIRRGDATEREAME